jgi:hypothetical protein
MEQGISKLLFNKILSDTNNHYKGRSFNKNTWNQRKENYATTRQQGLRLKRIDFGRIDHKQWNEESRNIRKSYYLVSSHVKPLNENL